MIYVPALVGPVSFLSFAPLYTFLAPMYSHTEKACWAKRFLTSSAVVFNLGFTIASDTNCSFMLPLFEDVAFLYLMLRYVLSLGIAPGEVTSASSPFALVESTHFIGYCQVPFPMCAIRVHAFVDKVRINQHQIE